MGERGNFVKPPIRLSIFEDQFPFGVSQVTDRHAIRQDRSTFHIKRFQSRNRRKQRISDLSCRPVGVDGPQIGIDVPE